MKISTINIHLYKHFLEVQIAVLALFVNSFTVYLLIFTRYRDRTVFVIKLWSQISHPNCTLFTVPLILNESN
jgi:hypothetical protein